VSAIPELMTPEEAAAFLRVSRSMIYQRQDIPRHRLPRSRQIRFLRSELLAWVTGEVVAPKDEESQKEGGNRLLTLATQTKGIYHRNARYR